MRFVLIVPHADQWPAEVIRSNAPTHQVVERYQRNLAKMQIPGRSNAVTYQVHDGDWVSALIASHKLDTRR